MYNDRNSIKHPIKETFISYLLVLGQEPIKYQSEDCGNPVVDKSLAKELFMRQ